MQTDDLEDMLKVLIKALTTIDFEDMDDTDNAALREKVKKIKKH